MSEVVRNSGRRSEGATSRASRARPDRLPGDDAELPDGARPGGGDLVLHLHGLDDEEALAALDRRPHLDENRDHLAGHDRPDLALSLARAGAGPLAERPLVEEAEPVRATVHRDRELVS